MPQMFGHFFGHTDEDSSANNKKRPSWIASPQSVTEFLNGAKETRTPDPLHAMQVLYQLSYGPNPARRP